MGWLLIIHGFLKRFWLPIVIVIGLVLLLVIDNYRLNARYKSGYDAGYQTMKMIADEAAKKQQQKINELSADYQKQKSEQEQKERVRYVRVQKVVERPVYRNVCIDDDGLRELNQAIADR